MKKKVVFFVASAVVASLAPMSFVAPSTATPIVQHTATTDQLQVSTVIPWGSSWSYYHAQGDLPGGPNFADYWYDTAGWQVGHAPFGWGRVELATPLDNTDPPITTNYRKTFNLDSPDAVIDASITVIANDGVVVYVNGIEVGRPNMAPGTIDRHTYAHSAYSVTETLTIPNELLRYGRNDVAVEAHLNYRKSPTVQFDAQLEITTGVKAGVERALQAGSTWRYSLQSRSNYLDWAGNPDRTKSWKTGAAPLGWGSPIIDTPLAGGVLQTLYAQTEFMVEDLATVQSATVYTMADDGVAVSVNGTEVGRANLPAGYLAWFSYANSGYGGRQEFTIPLELLKEGKNIISSEVHVNYKATPTLMFDAQVDLQRTTTPGADPADLPGWGLPVWADEFNAPNIDESRWRVRDDDYMGYDQAYIYADNVSVRNGNLVIATNKLLTPIMKSDGIERWWSTGYIDTIPTFSQQYGRWEIRAKLPLVEGNSAGIWPAIWLRDSLGRGEIDIMEAIGAPHDRHSVSPDGTWAQTIHESTGHEVGTSQIDKAHYPTGSDSYIWDEWHTWALEWTPEKMTFFFDDEVSWEVTYADYPWLATAFTDAGVNIRINTQVGSSWSGWVDPTEDNQQLPAEFLIDYVRVWELPPSSR